jgi:hypothetical protein
MTAVAANPDAFPFQFDGMIVRYGRTVWNVRGHLVAVEADVGRGHPSLP